MLKHIEEARHSVSTRPVTLQFAVELGLADQLGTGLFDAAQGRLVRGRRGAADSIDHLIDLVAIPQHVQSRETETGLGPQRRHDDLFAARGFHGLLEFYVFPTR